jgi:2-aminoethylphosphonate-pyruvate transaminase
MLLLLPGPVSTDARVRAAMAQDIAPWDHEFRAVIAASRERLLAIGGGMPGVHAVLPLQGSGHFVMEATLRSFLPAGGRVLVPQTGSYGERIIRLARGAGREPVALPVAPGSRVDPRAVAAALAADPTLSHVALVYSETGNGVVHDVAAVADAVALAGRRMLVDAVSAFGAMPLDLARMPAVDAAVFTPNKCLEAFAGMGFVVVRTERLVPGIAGSWCLDLQDVHVFSDAEGPGRLRFTPSAQVLAALAVALDLLDAEGGPAARLARYQANARVLYDGMTRLGLAPLLSREMQGPVVTTIHAPADPAWDVRAFAEAMKRRGFLVSNFRTTVEPTFRLGSIGAITPEDMARAVAATDAALSEIGVRERWGGT